MFFLNLTGPEFFTLLAALGGLISALYLLDRARGRKTVSTLQFWVDAVGVSPHQPRKRVREPWSLLLQLLALLLLLLAIADFEFGSREGRAHDHVLLLDTSSWSGARVRGENETVLGREKQEVRSYLAALPPNDRVMLVSAASVAAPLTRFTRDRAETLSALERAESGFTALNARAMMSFAAQARTWSENESGEIVYTGPQMTAFDQVPPPSPDRVLPVAVDLSNCGIREFTAVPLDTGNTWQALVRLKNYGSAPRHVRLKIRFGGSNFTPREFVIPAGSESSAEYRFTTQSAGELVAQIDGGDSLSSDDRASIFLPAREALRIAVYSSRPNALKPLIESNARVSATFFSASKNKPQINADLTVIDGIGEMLGSDSPTLWIEPPEEHGPLPVKMTVNDALVSWNGFEAKPVRVGKAEVFETFKGDRVLASVPEGAVALVRPASHGHPALALWGFDPAAGALHFDVAAPLLFAATLDTVHSGALLAQTFSDGEVGLARIHLNREEEASRVQVSDIRGNAIPFTRRAGELQLFVEKPTTIHVRSAWRDKVLEIKLPALGERFWKAENAASGVPSRLKIVPHSVFAWKWLALSAALLLLIEWYLFGRGRRLPNAGGDAKRAVKRDRELVMK